MGGKNPIQHWNLLVDEQVAAGKTRPAAIRCLAQRYPNLHREMLCEANASRPQVLRQLGNEAAAPPRGAGKFWDLVDAAMKRGLSRARAIADTVHHHPEAHRALLLNANVDRPWACSEILRNFTGS